MHPLNRNDGKLLTTKLQCSRLRILSPRFSFFLSIVASTGSSAFRLLGWRFRAGILLNSKRLYRSVSVRRLPSKTSCKWRTMRAQRWREILNILTADQNDRGCLFEAGRLLNFSAFRMALVRGWALIRINTVVISRSRTLKNCNKEIGSRCFRFVVCAINSKSFFYLPGKCSKR